MAGSEIAAARATAPREAASDGNKTDVGRNRPVGQQSVASGHSEEQFTVKGTHRGHLRTPRRDATAPPELCKPPPRATGAKKTWGESGRPGSEALPVENREHGFAKGARAAGILGRGGAAQKRGPHLCKTPVRNKTREQRDAAWRRARSHSREQERPVTPRATDAQQTWGEVGPPDCRRSIGKKGLRFGHASRASSGAAPRRNNAAASVQTAAAGDWRKEDVGREQPAGQRCVAGRESGGRFENWARAADIFGRGGAAQQRGPHLCNPPVRSERREQRDVAWHARDHSVARENAPCHRGRRTQSRLVARSARRAAINCKRRIGTTVCGLGEHRGHLRTPRRGATLPPHLCKPPPWATDANARRGVRAAGPAARRCRWRIGSTVSDLGTRRKNLRTPWRGATMRAASLQTAGPERDARTTPCDVEAGEIASSRAAPPRDAAGDGRKANVGRDRPAGQQGVASGESGNVLAMWARVAGIFGRRSAAQQCRRICASRRRGRGETDVGPGSEALPAENRANEL